ncbi:MAG: hypothetical protein ABL895_09010 [Cyclobacteriaceae bacterium]
MKKLISFSMFLAIVLIVVVAKTSQAQVTVKVRPCISAPATIWVNGFWKWSPSYKRHVWVEGHWVSRPVPRKVRARCGNRSEQFDWLRF